MFVDHTDPFVASLRNFELALAALGRAGSYHSALNIYLCSSDLRLGNIVLNLNLTRNGPWSEVCR